MNEETPIQESLVNITFSITIKVRKNISIAYLEECLRQLVNKHFTVVSVKRNES